MECVALVAASTSPALAAAARKERCAAFLIDVLANLGPIELEQVHTARSLLYACIGCLVSRWMEYARYPVTHSVRATASTLLFSLA